MSRKLNAILLSALVLPGLGQFYLGRRLKGGIIIALVNLFLLAALALMVKGMGAILLLSRGGAEVTPEIIIRTLHENAPGARWLIILFCGLWVYGIVDLFTTKEADCNSEE